MLEGALTAGDSELIDAQYADRTHLRPVLDAVLDAALKVGDVQLAVRRTQVSLVGPLRTFGIVQSTNRQRVDVVLRLAGVQPHGRASAVRGNEYTLRLELGAVEDVDADAITWLRRAYAENTKRRERRSPGPRPRPLDVRAVRVVVEGVDLPGRTCRNPDGEGHICHNVHVGMRCNDTTGSTIVIPDRPWTVVGLVDGDAERARWEIDVTTRRYDDGYDFAGEFVTGPPGQRSISLGWGELSDDGIFKLFRGLGLRFQDIPDALLDKAFHEGLPLVARLGLTDAKGNPRCAGVRPPVVTWSIDGSHP